MNCKELYWHLQSTFPVLSPLSFSFCDPLLIVLCSALCSVTLSLFLPLEEGHPTFSDKGPQPLLLVGSQAAHVKFTSSGTPYYLNYCVTPGLEYEIGSLPT